MFNIFSFTFFFISFSSFLSSFDTDFFSSNLTFPKLLNLTISLPPPARPPIIPPIHHQHPFKYDLFETSILALLKNSATRFAFLQDLEAKSFNSIKSISTEFAVSFNIFNSFPLFRDNDSFLNQVNQASVKSCTRSLKNSDFKLLLSQVKISAQLQGNVPPFL
ncbi:MAG: hypothetical protein LBU14_00780 [Candidatus Peribacteria bacterium]|nr:hypothetical protein [Candidatus Peribacteria bacterium]